MRQSITQLNGNENNNSKNSLVFKSNYQLVRIKTDEIMFIKALSDYVIIKTKDSKYITLSTMKDMLKNLPDDSFARAHRSFIVNIDKVNFVKGSSIIMGEDNFQFTIPIGRAYKKEFKQTLNS